MRSADNKGWWLPLALGALIWLLTPLAAAGSADNEQLRKLYQRGYKAFAANHYDKAKAAFRALLPRLQTTQTSQHKPNSRGWHMMSFGRFDVLYHLAWIAQKQKQPQRACRHFANAQQLVATIPASWTTWKVNPNIPLRLQETKQQLAACRSVPGYLILKGLPPQARVSIRSKSKRWQAVKTNKIPVLSQAVALKIEAPGYQSHVTKELGLTRWHTKILAPRLVKKPAPRKVVVRKRFPPPRKLPPPPSATQTWWFWFAVGAGVVVASGVAIGVGVYAAQHPSTDTLNGPNGGTIRIW